MRVFEETIRTNLNIVVVIYISQRYYLMKINGSGGNKYGMNNAKELD